MFSTGLASSTRPEGTLPPTSGPAPSNPLDWISGVYGEETNIPGASNAGTVVVLKLGGKTDRSNATTNSAEFHVGGSMPINGDVALIGGTTGVYLLGANAKKHVVTKLLLPAPSPDHSLQAIASTVLDEHDAEGYRQCLLVVGHASPMYEMSFFKFAPRRSMMDENGVAPKLLRVFSFAHLLPLRLLSVPTTEGRGPLLVATFINHGLAADDSGSMYRTFNYADGRVTMCEAPSESDPQGDTSNPSVTEGGNTDDKEQHDDPCAVFSRLWKEARPPAPVYCHHHFMGFNAFGCIDGTVVVTSNTGAREERIFSGPIGGVQFFLSDVEENKEFQSNALHSHLAEFCQIQTEQPLRLAAIDTMGSVIVFTGGPTSVTTPSELLSNATRVKDVDRTVLLAPPYDLIKVDSTQKEDSKVSASTAPSEGRSVTPPQTAETVVVKQSWLAYGREKLGALVRKDPHRKATQIKKVGSTLSVMSSQDLGASPNIGNSSLGGSTPSMNTPWQQSQAADFLTNGKAISETVGSVLSRGPVSLSIDDFDGDGKNEIAVTTMGRALAWCRQDIPERTSLDHHQCSYSVHETTKMPSQMYYLGLVDIYQDGEEVALLCGPEHVIVCRRIQNDMTVSCINERLAMLETLLLRGGGRAVGDETQEADQQPVGATEVFT